ncbi:hypothetical protein WICMUC_004552 [Wickerhamomyces mucosus]|uniref:Glutamyl-tRNA(Gln) amidotransferase subunit B, mitochondrial n=1 Tax=Wickerhamomyces mucosus TaxID=1378264 RepID=A0A9P8TAN6_9ASCO|nr:hypothetical protein WICMUC_004552 [Wickerhamomyces mucosus]
MLRFVRFKSHAVSCSEFQLKCGVEIHTQLNTNAKLFSLSSNNSFNSKPNKFISYFDIALPGTQPILNNEALLYALKLSKALNSSVNLNSSFDRKHYFYGDQPLGYQITQHFQPIAKGGYLKIFPRDGVKDELTVEIEQLQIEQDTGKSVYFEEEISSSGTSTKGSLTLSKIDLNRANLPLIEMVTKPNFTDANQVKIFIKKFQNLVRYLNICTGDLETGAMRIDVNVSVNGNSRVELKNLSTTSSVINAIKFEYKRQVQLIKDNKESEIVQETRGWDGKRTNSLRNKETSLDYKYFPDPELPKIHLDSKIMDQLSIGILPDEMLTKLINRPYQLSLKDATILTNDLSLLDYYLKLFELSINSPNNQNTKLPGNFVIHELLGNFAKLNLKFDSNLISVSKLNELLELINTNKITQSSAKLLLQHLFNNQDDINKNLFELVEEFDLIKQDDNNNQNNSKEIETICEEIISQNPKTVKNLNSKPNGLKFLIGQAMRLTQGKINALDFENQFKKLLNL